ncbi:ribosome assembly RNA-binding protein YhbY [Desulfogranum mediterraneum]|uniref:ribosome assembly RNA-binding protein YhbY n=1 Tax=Desulfogranum mediterraneum TaxID=160661 RepID=UPI00041D4D9C|nr:ribosome assembly RNA-binding protein YhbY [Desulfogranum mediterraneum]
MTEDHTPSLTTRQKKNLRGHGHHLEPTVYVGKEGVTASVVKAAASSLKAHELIKIKLGSNCPLAKKEAAELLAEQSEATLVQLIGKMVLLYRANPELPRDKQLRP